MSYFQTGDVIYHEEKSIPVNLKKIAGNLIHQGRDHHHLIDGDFELFDGNDGFFIDAKSTCKLTHPEHKTIELPAGIYRKGIVVEYDHLTEESRQVID